MITTIYVPVYASGKLGPHFFSRQLLNFSITFKSDFSKSSPIPSLVLVIRAKSQEDQSEIIHSFIG